MNSIHGNNTLNLFPDSDSENQEIVIVNIHEWKSGDLLTTPEVAAMLDVSPAWVSELCRQGRVPGAIQRGRFWFIPFESVNNIEAVKMGRPPKIGG